MTGPLPRRPLEVAAYFHRTLEALLFQEVRRPSHALGRHVGIARTAVLKSPHFVFDRNKWQAWREPGTPCHGADDPECRRFGEVRGIWTPGSATPDKPDAQAVEVLFNPKVRPDFHTSSGNSVRQADSVLILGRRMFASGLRAQALA